MRKPAFCICENKDANLLSTDDLYFYGELTNESFKMSCVMRKPVFRVPDQACTNGAVQPQKMASGLKFGI